jgi:hypothetical protein
LFREHWREPAFWRWWWKNRMPAGAKIAAVAALLLVLLGVGFIVAARLTAREAVVVGGQPVTVHTTVSERVTVRGRDHVEKRVEVVTLVTRNGTTRTIRDTKVVPTTRTQTQTLTETRTRTQTKTRTNLRTQIVTVQRTQVVTSTTTSTVTQPVTVVETRTLPAQTVTQTVPVTVILTITLPKLP